jgi:predicted RNase H-like HicB family nuclease
MAGYVALVHKDEGTSYGVSFPDVPGCISAGDTFEEALANAAEALAGHLALMRGDGDLLPKPRSVGAIRADPRLADELEGAAIEVVEPATTPVHAN